MFRMENQTRFWLLVLALVAALLWLLKPVLPPFLTGMIIAYFLNPVVNGLAERKIPRWIGALVVLVGFGVIVGGLLTLILPLFERQVVALIAAAPEYMDKIRQDYIPNLQDWFMQFAPMDADKLQNAAGQSVTQAAGWLAGLLQHIVSSGFAIVDIFAFMIITPVVAFFMLRDWPKLTESIDSVFPRRYYDVIHAQLAEINSTLSGFIRGQALVCTFLGTYYAIALTVTGLKYGATIGIIAGFLTFIPFVGTSFGWISSLLLAIAQFNGAGIKIIEVLGVFVVGHVTESYFLTPRLVGNRVGLHPVWILFALITGAKLMGFTGILIAMPAAAVIGVLVRFMVRQYKTSAVYKDVL